MYNLVLGILAILVSGLLFWRAWWCYSKQKHVQSLILLSIGGLILRLFVGTDFYLHEWDERYHALVAKNMIHFPLKPMLYIDPILPFDYTSWNGNHIWMHKQPMTLWGMALSLWVFGTNELALRLPSILFTTAGIALTYGMTKDLFNRRVAFVSAFLFAIHGLIIEVSAGRVATDHVDIFFLFFTQLAVYMAILFFKKQKPYLNILCGLFIGLAILSKWLPALIVLPIWWAIGLHFKPYSVREMMKYFLLLVVTLVIVFVPWQIFALTYYNAQYVWESAFNMLHITSVLEDQGGAWYYHFDKLRINYGELIYLPVAWFIYLAVKNRVDFKLWVITIWFLGPFLFFSVVATKMQAYTLFTAPAIFIMSAVFWDALMDNRNMLKFRWLGNVVLVLLIALPIRFSVERIKPFEILDRNPSWVKEIHRINELGTNQKSVVFNMHHPIETMFYTDVTAYESIPAANTIDEIMQRGYHVYIYDNDKIPGKIRDLNGIEIIDLKGE